MVSWPCDFTCLRSATTQRCDGKERELRDLDHILSSKDQPAMDLETHRQFCEGPHAVVAHLHRIPGAACFAVEGLGVGAGYDTQIGVYIEDVVYSPEEAHLFREAVGEEQVGYDLAVIDEDLGHQRPGLVRAEVDDRRDPCTDEVGIALLPGAGQ